MSLFDWPMTKKESPQLELSGVHVSHDLKESHDGPDVAFLDWTKKIQCGRM